VVEIILRRAEDGFEVGAAFQQTGQDEGDGPDRDDYHPENEEAAKHDAGEEMPVETNYRQLDEAESCDSQEQV